MFLGDTQRVGNTRPQGQVSACFLDIIAPFTALFKHGLALCSFDASY